MGVDGPESPNLPREIREILPDGENQRGCDFIELLKATLPPPDFLGLKFFLRRFSCRITHPTLWFEPILFLHYLSDFVFFLFLS